MPPARSNYTSEEAAAQKAKAKQKGKNPRPNTDAGDGALNSKKVQAQRKANPGPATVNRRMPDERNATQHTEPSSSAGPQPKSSCYGLGEF
ncbi:hypothetical protein RhiJN_27725 [Ceratobasidium sp. AG-Ba]|nr:hypothetical protein RhiJN_27725 [Ceratobasidium sp. AG-Ba]